VGKEFTKRSWSQMYLTLENQEWLTQEIGEFDVIEILESSVMVYANDNGAVYEVYPVGGVAIGYQRA
jgi:hypothetical protein